MISLTAELHEKLGQEDNASGLIARLLQDHYDGTKLEGYSVKEIQQLRKLVIQRDEAEAEIKAMEVENEFRRAG